MNIFITLFTIANTLFVGYCGYRIGRIKENTNVLNALISANNKSIELLDSIVKDTEEGKLTFALVQGRSEVADEVFKVLK